MRPLFRKDPDNICQHISGSVCAFLDRMWYSHLRDNTEQNGANREGGRKWALCWETLCNQFLCPTWFICKIIGTYIYYYLTPASGIIVESFNCFSSIVVFREWNCNVVATLNYSFACPEWWRGRGRNSGKRHFARKLYINITGAEYERIGGSNRATCSLGNTRDMLLLAPIKDSMLISLDAHR